MSKHCPAPWYATKGRRHWQIRATGSFEYGNQTVERQLLVGDVNCGAPEIKAANAKHIVHCVNTYDQLVAALQKARDYITQETNEPGEFNVTLNGIDSALLLAQEPA
jgi:hypothetical protein